MLDTIGNKIALKIELNGETLSYSFDDSFSIGRDEKNDLSIADKSTSRFHARVERKDEGWWFQDLKSTNGSFVSGQRIDGLFLKGSTEIVLGGDGPRLLFETNEQQGELTHRNDQLSPTQYYKHYFKDSHQAGEHTMMMQGLQ